MNACWPIYSGVVFNDINGNGLKDPGENGIPGVLITLSNGATTTTGAGGSYSFSNLQPGDYSVTETDPSGYSSTTSNTVAVTVPPGGSAVVNFGVAEFIPLLIDISLTCSLIFITVTIRQRMA